MNKYKVRYSICTEFEAKSDDEAEKINEKNLNAIFRNGEFFVTNFKFEQEVVENVDTDTESAKDH